MAETPADIKAAFERDGYYHARKVFSGEQLIAMEMDYDRIVQQLRDSGEAINARWGGELTEALDGGQSEILHTHQVQRFSAVWLKAIQDPVFLDIAEAIVGPDIVLHHTKLFCKPPEKGSPFPTEKDTMFAGIIHVSRATNEMGCLRVYPGSHRLGRQPGTQGQGRNREIAETYPIEDATVVEAEPGDVLFFHYFTLHGSMPNRSSETRKTVLVQLLSGQDLAQQDHHTCEDLVLRGWHHHMTRNRAAR